MATDIYWFGQTKVARGFGPRVEKNNGIGFWWIAVLVYAVFLNALAKPCLFNDYDFIAQALEELRNFMIVAGVATKEHQKLMRNLRVNWKLWLKFFWISLKILKFSLCSKIDDWMFFILRNISIIFCAPARVAYVCLCNKLRWLNVYIWSSLLYAYPVSKGQNHGLEPWPGTMAQNHDLEPWPGTMVTVGNMGQIKN